MNMSDINTGTKVLPKISLVTPSFNQADYLEESMLSVLNQQYSNLEYVVIDGGSSDGSTDIIKKHVSRLAHWVSEPDGGMYQGINKGLKQCSGDIMGWLNSDDMYCPWTLKTVARIFTDCPEIKWLTTAVPMMWSHEGMCIKARYLDGFSRDSFRLGANLNCGHSFYAHIQQESTFWRRELWDAAGGHLDESFNYAGDFELWDRFWNYADLYAAAIPLGGFRIHQGQKTGNYSQYLDEAIPVIAKYHMKSPGFLRLKITRKLIRKFPGICGRLLGHEARQVYFDSAADVFKTRIIHIS